MEDERLTERVLSRREVFRGKLIRVEHWDAELPDGRVALREIVLHVGAAAVVPVDARGNVTLVRQHRIAMGKTMTEIPAGKKDAPDEDPLCCARRELAEETGLRAERFQYITTLDTSPGFLTERIALYVATGLSQGETHPDDDEFLRLAVMPLEDAARKIFSGEITDAKTVCGLLAARTLWKEGKLS